jgi:hypothetical protein
MTVTTIYRTEVVVPEDVYQAFGHLVEFNKDVLAAITHLPAGGQGGYGSVYIWGEGPLLSDVQHADKALHALIQLYKLRLSSQEEV